MKNQKKTASSFVKANRIGVSFTVSALALICFAWSAKSDNLLQNPGFETSPGFTGWTRYSTESWSISPSTALVRTGVNSLWMQGLYLNGGAPAYYNMYAHQTFACAPGSLFTADAFFSQYVYDSVHQGGDNGAGSGLFSSDASGEEDGWVEVAFMDGDNNILSDYKSVILTPDYVNNLAATGATVTNSSGNIYLDWVDCQVTNQYDISTIGPNTDPVTETVSNTLSGGQYMLAPPGTKSVQFRLAISQAQYESGATYWDDCALNLVGGPSASIITGFSPDGSKFFNIEATNFTFRVHSAAQGGAALPDNPTNGIQVLVNGTDESRNLQFNGYSTNWVLTLPNLESNKLYNISISVSNSVGLTSTANTSFDTFGTNDFIVTSEDYDYDSGQFIQNPVPTSTAAANSYFGRAGVLGIDESTYGGTGTLPAGASQLVRTDGNVAFERSSDLQLPIYLAANDPNVYNVDISYNNAGNWENYTRVYPSGVYLVYARISGGQGYGIEYLNLLTSGYGTASQTTTNLGAFVLQNGADWGHFMWIPLTDSDGNVVSVSVPAGRQTLQLLSGGGENVISFMFVPLPSGGLPPVIGNLNPPLSQANAFVNAANITFSVSSSTSTVATNEIQTLLNGTDVSSLASFSGSNTDWSVSVPVPRNQILTLAVNATDADGMSNSLTKTFDTFSQSNLMIEAEDFDFNAGQFIDNPVPTGPNGSPEADSYFLYPAGDGANMAVTNVDFVTLSVPGKQDYRPLDFVGTEVSSDFLRDKFINNGVTNSDYDLGWWNAGAWVNYTRTFPTNSYNVYGRLAGGGPFSGTTLSLVTSGQGTTSQTTRPLGSFADPTANGWQNWHWAPMRGANGQVATVSLGGVDTVRATSGGGLNANYYMFVAVTPPLNITASINGQNIVIGIPTQPNASYTVLYNTNLTGGSWRSLGAAISGDGSVKTVTDTMGTSQRFYKIMVQ